MATAGKLSGATATFVTPSWTILLTSFVIVRVLGSSLFKLTSNPDPSRTPSTSFVQDCKSVLTKSFFESTLLAEELVFGIRGAGFAALEAFWTLQQ